MLYVIRHGKTDWNNRKKTMGRMDLPLCPEGIAQAHEMKDKLKYNNFDLIMCSPLTRAKETAKIINEGKDIEIVYDQRLLERNLANLEGRSYPEDNDRLWDINVNADDFYIETMEEFKDRVYDFMDDIKKSYDDKNILVVTHGGVTALINCYFDGTLYDGPITDKFLDNCEIESFNMKKARNKVYTPNE
ncbi:MAG: histidine phosphatase family protein [Bacilli bacterium]|nr:histidine phosphatase family protein [Bacilli bacterium]